MKIKDCFMRRNHMIVVIDANEKAGSLYAPGKLIRTNCFFNLP